MKIRILYVHEPDGPREILEIEALGDFRPALLDFTKAKAGVIETVRLPESLVIDYSEWQEFPDDVHNRSHFRSALGNVLHYQHQLPIAQKFAVEIIQRLMGEMGPIVLAPATRPAKEGIEGIKFMDWENPPKRKHFLKFSGGVEGLALKALATAKKFRDWLNNNSRPSRIDR